MPKYENTAAAVTQDSLVGERIPEIGRALALLSEVLAIADAQGFPPEIGARLEELIDSVERELADRELAESFAKAFSQSE